MAFSWRLGGWRERRGPRAGVTIIQGWNSRLGVGVAGAAGGLLLPLLLAVGGVREALLGLAGCLALGFGFGYRLVVAPEGLLYQFTWYGVPWRRQRLPLQVPVVEASTFEQPEPEDLILEGARPVTLPASKHTVGALKQAVQEAILRAQASTESR
ncbi:hypothetical protein [Archangium sp.]|jgi:hypothetical protein|uniref:hypothetical protein n=1 Tax=Archangium sp. TaxID=1872627 RepID=UPI002ED905C9